MGGAPWDGPPVLSQHTLMYGVDDPTRTTLRNIEGIVDSQDAQERLTPFDEDGQHAFWGTQDREEYLGRHGTQSPAFMKVKQDLDDLRQQKWEREESIKKAGQLTLADLDRYPRDWVPMNPEQERILRAQREPTDWSNAADLFDALDDVYPIPADVKRQELDPNPENRTWDLDTNRYPPPKKEDFIRNGVYEWIDYEVAHEAWLDKVQPRLRVGRDSEHTAHYAAKVAAFPIRKFPDKLPFMHPKDSYLSDVKRTDPKSLKTVVEPE